MIQTNFEAAPSFQMFKACMFALILIHILKLVSPFVGRFLSKTTTTRCHDSAQQSSSCWLPNAELEYLFLFLYLNHILHNQYIPY